MFFFFFLSIYMKISIFTTENCFFCFEKVTNKHFNIPHHSTIYVDLLLIYNLFYDRSWKKI